MFAESAARPGVAEARRELDVSAGKDENQRSPRRRQSAASPGDCGSLRSRGGTRARNGRRHLVARLRRDRLREESGYGAGVIALGVIQQPAVRDPRGCFEAPPVVGPDDRFRCAVGFRNATALATPRSCRSPAPRECSVKNPIVGHVLGSTTSSTTSALRLEHPRPCEHAWSFTSCRPCASGPRAHAAPCRRLSRAYP